MSNFAPKTEEQTQRPIQRQQGAGFAENFGAGMFDDLPITPKNGVKYLKNYVCYPDRIQPRRGCKYWADTVFPALYTGYHATGTVTDTDERTIVKTAGEDFTSSSIGSYFVNDAGVHERIISYTDANTVKTRITSSTQTDWSCSNGWTRGKVNTLYYHKSQKKILLQIDTRIFYADDLDVSGWTQAFCVSYNTPNNTVSKADEFNQYAYFFNSGGIFKIDVSADPMLFFKINTPTVSTRITGSGISANGERTATYDYGRRYLISMARLSGSGLRNRMDSGVNIIHETGTTQIDSDGKDWGEIYKDRPFGLGNTYYGILTGAALGGSYDTPAEWAAITNGQFTISIGGTSRNCKCNFSRATTMKDVADIIQSAIRSQFPTSNATCVYTTDHFVITAPNENTSGTATDIITVTSAGDAGTDIGSAAMSCESGTGTVTTPAYSDPEVIADITYPTDSVSGYSHYHDDFACVYCSLDIGPNGTDVLTGEGNNPELYVWNADIPIARAFSAQENSSNLITLAAGEVFHQADVGNTLVYDTGDESVIQYLCDSGGTRVYTDTSRYAIGNFGTISGYTGAAIGGGSIFKAAQATLGTETVGNATVTVEGSFPANAENYVRRTIFWEDGTCSHIVRYVGHSPVRFEVAEDDTVTSQYATINPTGRKYNDTIPDYTLRARIAGESLKQRFWQPLPQCNVGVVANGFMFSAATNDTKVYYSQMPTYYEYLAGQYNEAYQYAEMKDGIQELVEFPDKVIVFCNHSTLSLPTNNYEEQPIPDIGENVIVISGQTVVDHNIGTTYGGVTKKDQNTAIVITREPAIRLFDGTKYGENMAADRLMNKLRALQAAYLTSYDPVNGFLFWGLDDTE